MTHTPEELRDLIDYNPDTGAFIWRERHDDGSPATRKFNARYAGNPVYLEPHYGYSRIGLNGGRKRYKAHRVAWAIHYGEWPEDQIDHINGVRDDNRIANLRCVTHAENCKNKRLPDDSMSGVFGIVWDKTHWVWRVTIGNSYLGSFESFRDAYAVRKEAEEAEGYHENHGVPPEKFCV